MHIGDKTLSIIQTKIIIKAVIDEKITKIMKRTTMPWYRHCCRLESLEAKMTAAHVTKVPADFQAEKVRSYVPGYDSVRGR
jgi:hypothetical protein